MQYLRKFMSIRLSQQGESRKVKRGAVVNLNSDTVRIGKLFAEGFFFSVPNYQRPFSWDRDQLSDLIDDLMAAKRDTDYFLGTLVLHETAPESFDIVDGQQRLTALSILLACLRDLLESDADEVQDLLVQPEKKFQGIPSRPRLSVRDSGPYERIVVRSRGTLDSEIEILPLDATARRYRDAVSIFRDALVGQSQDYLRGLIEFIVQHVVVIYLAASSFDDAFRLFTVVNDRGKQLRRIDVLKAINLSPSEISHDDLREEYARKWEGYEEALGERDFEALFAALRLIYVQEKPEGDLLHEFETRIYNKPGRPSPGTDFINSLGEYVDLWDAIFIARDFLADTEDNARFKTLMHAMVGEFRASEWRACVLSFAGKFGKSDLMTFLFALERLFVDQWVRGVRKDERYSSYTGVLKSIDVSVRPATVIESMDVGLEAVQNACRESKFYGSGFAKYLLVRAEIQATELIEPREFSPRSIEHILPQNPRAESQWLTDFTVDEIKSLVHSVGNLVLLSKSKNSSAQNKDFSEKKATYLSPRVSDYPRSVGTLGYESWTPEVIRKRTEEFANTILKPI
ncbi:DUF262 domain-containing HNH endonuclease family protein [Nocardioides sp.]|uniref:DUF262 domain-containing protein n=1 Tax=Nocardioides sp. TaxID=35761 RepID=UPI0026114D8F|nr:DUF262 domain-containing HNH endonuclease family protein [Nocardioides sp.]